MGLINFLQSDIFLKLQELLFKLIDTTKTFPN